MPHLFTQRLENILTVEKAKIAISVGMTCPQVFVKMIWGILV